VSTPTPPPPPPPLSTEARTTLATALAATNYQIYDHAPEVPRPPALVVTPDTPWIRMDRIGGFINYEVRLKVLVVVAAKRNNAQLEAVEKAVDLVLENMPVGFVPDLIGPPQLTDIGAQGTVTTVEINVSAHMKKG